MLTLPFLAQGDQKTVACGRVQESNIVGDDFDKNQKVEGTHEQLQNRREHVLPMVC